MNNISISPEAENKLMNNALDYYTGPIIGRCSRQALLNGVLTHLEELEKKAGDNLTGAYQLIFSIQVMPTDLVEPQFLIPAGHSEEVTKFTKLQCQILCELSKALNKIKEVPGDILMLLSSWGDTLPDEDILQMMKETNAKIPPLQ